MGCIISKNKINNVQSDNIPDYYWFSHDDCCVCMDNKCNILLLPCNHLVLCGDCAQQIYNSTNLCPVCQTEICNYSYLKLDIIF